MRHEVVIARYAEDLDWVADIPGDFAVRIYNKGAPITSRAVLDRADSVVALANSGRESDTFLRHILALSDGGQRAGEGAAVDGPAGDGRARDGHIAFLQGGPQEHSPDVIALLRAARHWREVQPLSWCWLSSKNLPPPGLLARETNDFVDGARVRAELFSLSNWSQLQFADPGAKTVCDMYLDIHGLPDGSNIAADFLRRCEWEEQAVQAERHLVGRFAYGAMFAVRRDRLARLPRRPLELALQAANGHKVYGYVLERLWLHLFGEPFLLPAAMPATSALPAIFQVADDLAQRSRFVPQAPPTPPHLRVVPAIKRRISRWAQN